MHRGSGQSTASPNLSISEFPPAATVDRSTHNVYFSNISYTNTVDSSSEKAIITEEPPIFSELY